MSYIGKIAAIVTANTFEYRRGLGEAASETKRFATTIEGNIKRATAEAQRSFNGILLPIQKFEASLKAAASQRLSFAGFQGAIRTVEELKTRLGSLKQSEVSLVLKRTGFEKLDDLRESLREFSNRDLRIVADVGGVEKLRELATMARPLTSGNTLVRMKVKDEELNSLLAKLDKISVRKITAAIEVLNASGLDDAQAKLRALVSVSKQLAQPLEAAVNDLSRMGAGVQAGLVPALSLAQKALQNMNRDIEAGTAISEQRFSGVERRVMSVITAIKQLGEASASLSGLKTGSELAFANPRLAGNLARGQELGQKSAALPSEFLQNNTRIPALLAQVKSLSEAAVEAQARLLGATNAVQTDSARKQLDALQSILESTFREIDKEHSIRLNAEKAKSDLRDMTKMLDSLNQRSAFVITGRAQNLDQADTRRGSLESGISDLNRSQRQNFKPLLQQADVARAKGDLDQYMDVLDQIEYKLKSIQRQDLNEAAAKRAADEIRVAMEAIGKVNPSTPIELLKKNLEEARAAVSKLTGEARRLGEGNIARIEAFVGNNAGNEQAAALAARRAGELTGQAGQAADLQADAKRRAEAASRFLNVDQRESDLQSKEGRATRLSSGYLQEMASRRARGQLGPELATGTAGTVNSLRQAIVGVKGQIDRLPDAMRSRFLPAIRDAEREFIRLSASPRRVPAEIENARRAVARLAEESRNASRAMNFSARFGGGQFGGGLNEVLQARSLQGLEGELTVLQNALGKVSVEARSKALPSFYALRDAISDAAEKGTLDTEEFIATLEKLRAAAVKDAAAVAGISARGLGDAVKRAGDVGRGGFDKFSLAAQQAGFAIDDFMSSTGGLDQKLRAVSNNITQMAFILGGTYGLFIGLGAVIGGQVAAAMVKWYNNGRTAEDQTKALNDALARQKSLVEELAQAFESLGDSLLQGVFSEAADRARQFGEQIDDIKRKQKELREDRVASTDLTVQRERAEQNKLNAQLEKEQDPGRRVALEEQIRESKDREGRAAAAAVEAKVPGGLVRQEVERSVLMAQSAEARRGMPNDEEYARRLEEARRRAAAAGAQVNVGNDAEAKRNQIEQLKAARAGLVQASQEEMLPGVRSDAAARADVQLSVIDGLLKSLESEFRQAVDAIAVNILDASRGPAEQIRNAQEAVAEAIRRGVPGAAAFQQQLDENAKVLKEAQDKLREAYKIENVDEQRRAVEEAQKQVDRVAGGRDRIEAGMRDAALGRTFGGERTTSALSSLQGNDNFRNEGGRLIARVESFIYHETRARQRLNEAIASGDEAARARAQEELEFAQLMSEAAALAAEASLALEEALSRLRRIADSAVEASTRIADEAQREFTNNPTEENRKERDRREKELIRDRENVAVANARISAARTRAAQSPEFVDILNQMNRLDTERKQLEEDARINNTDNSDRLAEIEEEEAHLAARREELLYDATESERAYADSLAQGIAAREKAIQEERAMEERRKREENRFMPQNQDERFAAADRGRQLAMTEGQRAAEAVMQGMEDIRQNFALQAELGSGLIDQEGQKEAMERFANDQMRNAAPAIVQMAESVENALLQGPSRAALNATDASSVQGQSELNRLLRGDDPNRNANLVELRRQNEKLTEVVAAVKEVGVKMGVVLDVN